MRLRVSKKSLFLALISFAVVIYAEWLYPAKAFSQCVWPLGSSAKHIALIADPQLVDANTYPGRNGILMWLTQVVADRFMARNFRLLHSKLQPDAIFFVGDLFDGGREWENKEWNQEYERYRRVFPFSKKVAHHEYLPGNHDVGSTDDIIPNAFERFKAKFGSPNQVISIGDHSIVTLDTNSLMNQNRPDIYGPAKAFFDKLKEKQSEYEPMIVLSHIPLYRPEGGYCGFEREGKPFSWIKGNQYITEVDPTLSQDIIQSLKPAYIFSGDDHDVCKYIHRWGTDETSEEHTIKSFSLAMGVNRPGFQILSLDSRRRHQTDTCIVAKPFVPFIIQGVAFTLLVLACALYARLLTRCGKKFSSLPVSDKSEKRAIQEASNSTFKHEFIRCLVVLAAGWSVGQILVHYWSYSAHL